MKKFRNILMAVIVFLLASNGQCPKIQDIGTVSIPETEQEKTNWCWAASMQAVLDAYGTTVTQCQLANWLFSRADCCNPGTCNSGTSPEQQQDILDHWGLNSTLVYSTLTWNQLKTEIKASRPVSIGFSWCGGGGHSMVIYGFSEVKNGSVKYNVSYLDPWFGEGFNVAEYDWMVGGCPGDHTWYRTLYNIH